MEVHTRVNSVMAKRFWNTLRITFFMIRKGLISKRKLMMDMNLMMKRGRLLRKSVSNLMSRNAARGSFGIQEYEFSCSNSPNPVFFHVSKRKHHYFPCINPPEVIEEDEEPHLKSFALVPKTPEYTFNLRFDHASDLGQGEKRSPFSVRISNYSSEEEDDGGDRRVDHDAEEFIRRFYEQLRVQSRMQLLQYDDTHIQMPR